jgi:hypothetical protein
MDIVKARLLSRVQAAKLLRQAQAIDGFGMRCSLKKFQSAAIVLVLISASDALAAGAKRHAPKPQPPQQSRIMLLEAPRPEPPSN